MIEKGIADLGEASASPTFPRQLDSVALVAMGGSNQEYINTVAMMRGDKPTYFDEVWAINSMAQVIRHDRVFHMDPVTMFYAPFHAEYSDPEALAVLAAADDNERARWLADKELGPRLHRADEWVQTENYRKMLEKHPGPIYTSVAHPNIPGAVEFPLKEVHAALRGWAYFNTSIAYAIGFAIAKGVKNLHLYGCDFSYPNVHRAEMGRGNVEALIVLAINAGTTIHVAGSSTLLDMNIGQILYGYGVPMEDALRGERRIEREAFRAT